MSQGFWTQQQPQPPGALHFTCAALLPGAPSPTRGHVSVSYLFSKIPFQHCLLREASLIPRLVVPSSVLLAAWHVSIAILLGFLFHHPH